VQSPLACTGITCVLAATYKHLVIGSWQPRSPCIPRPLLLHIRGQVRLTCRCCSMVGEGELLLRAMAAAAAAAAGVGRWGLATGRIFVVAWRWTPAALGWRWLLTSASTWRTTGHCFQSWSLALRASLRQNTAPDTAPTRTNKLGKSASGPRVMLLPLRFWRYSALARCRLDFVRE
jgi:hypothetical protein